jgi:hypothetical protein
VAETSAYSETKPLLLHVFPLSAEVHCTDLPLYQPLLVKEKGLCRGRCPPRMLVLQTTPLMLILRCCCMLLASTRPDLRIFRLQCIAQIKLYTPQLGTSSVPRAQGYSYSSSAAVTQQERPASNMCMDCKGPLLQRTRYRPAHQSLTEASCATKATHCPCHTNGFHAISSHTADSSQCQKLPVALPGLL